MGYFEIHFTGDGWDVVDEVKGFVEKRQAEIPGEGDGVAPEWLWLKNAQFNMSGWLISGISGWVFETPEFKSALASFLERLHEEIPDATYYGEYVGDESVTGTYLIAGCGSFGWPAPCKTSVKAYIGGWNELPDNVRSKVEGYLVGVRDKHREEPDWLWSRAIRTDGLEWLQLPNIDSTLIDARSASTLTETLNQVSKMVPDASVTALCTVGLADAVEHIDLFSADLEELRSLQAASGVAEISICSPHGISGVSWYEAKRKVRRKLKVTPHMSDDFQRSLEDCASKLAAGLPRTFPVKVRKSKGLVMPQEGDAVILQTDFRADELFGLKEGAVNRYGIRVMNYMGKPVGQLLADVDDAIAITLSLGCLEASVVQADPMEVEVSWAEGASALDWHLGETAPILKYAGKNLQRSRVAEWQ